MVWLKWSKSPPQVRRKSKNNLGARLGKNGFFAKMVPNCDPCPNKLSKLRTGYICMCVEGRSSKQNDAALRQMQFTLVPIRTRSSSQVTCTLSSSSNRGRPSQIWLKHSIKYKVIIMQTAKPGTYVLQGLRQEPLTNLSGCSKLSDSERWMEAARIACPGRRNLQDAEAKRQQFIHRFSGDIRQARVYLSKVFCRKDTWRSFENYLRTGE